MLSKGHYVGTIAAALCLISLPSLLGVGISFHPDGSIEGSSLSGWHPWGQAEWKVIDGELTGKAKPGGAGGWLVLDKSLQDVGINASFRCGEGCQSGVLFRAEKTPAGWKGVFISLAPGATGTFRVTLDAYGRILTRERLRVQAGQLAMLPHLIPTRRRVRAAAGVLREEPVGAVARRRFCRLPALMPRIKAATGISLKPCSISTSFVRR